MHLLSSSLKKLKFEKTFNNFEFKSVRGNMVKDACIEKLNYPY